MEKRVNKKGQDLSIGTLILIVLGIIVLVLLILGFSMGWSNLWAKINVFGGSGATLTNVVQNCQTAVNTNLVYEYCSDFKEVTVEGKKEWVNCEDGRINPSIENKITCTGGEMDVRIKEKCKSLINAGNVKETTIVNSQKCIDVVKCSGSEKDTICPPWCGGDLVITNSKADADCIK